LASTCRGLRPEHDPVEARLVHLFPDANEVAIRAGHQAVEHLDDVEARAERRVHRSHLEPDDAAADDEHPLRDRGELQRSCRVEDAGIFRHERQPYRLRACGDDRVLEAHDGLLARLRLARAFGRLDLEVMRIEELADAADHVDLARLRHAGESAGQLADDLVLPAQQGGQIDLRRAERDAVLGERLRFVHHGGNVQQRLRRNATDVETHAAQRRVTLDQHRLHSQVGGAKRGAVAARSGAQDEHLAFDIRLAAVGGGAGNGPTEGGAAGFDGCGADGVAAGACLRAGAEGVAAGGADALGCPFAAPLRRSPSRARRSSCPRSPCRRASLSLP
jgi:hypothetical protein